MRKISLKPKTVYQMYIDPCTPNVVYILIIVYIKPAVDVR